jgi:hypothetical protein
VLDLQHRPDAGLVGGVALLGDDAVEACTLEAVEPIPRGGGVGGHGGDEGWRRDARERRLKAPPAVGEGSLPQVFVVVGEHVERHERGGCLPGEHTDARLRRVEAELECLEVDPILAHDHHLAVEHHRAGQFTLEPLAQLRKIPGQGLQVAALEVGLLAVEVHDCPEPIPLRLV